MDDRQMALLQDQAMTDAARVIGLRIAALGEGMHEIPIQDFARMIHGFPSSDTVARHLRQLELAGYIERKSGGRGHSDMYGFRSAVFTGPKNLDAAKTTDLSHLDAAPVPDLKPLVVEDDASRETPIVPLKGLDERAKDLLEGQYAELFKGFRGSYRDYLIERVTPARQYAHIQTVAGWMNGTDAGVWRVPRGGFLPRDEQPGIMASALNDLLQQVNGETGMRGPSGDARNLRTKITILIQKRGDVYERSGNSNNRAAQPEAQRATGTDDQSARRRKPIGHED